MNVKQLIYRLKADAARIAARIPPLGRFLWHFFSLSLADDRIAPMRCLVVQLAKGGTHVVYASRFLGRLRIRGIRHFPVEGDKYPTPEELAGAFMLAATDFKAERVPVTLVVPKAWTIVKTADFPRAVKENLPSVISYELDRLTPLTAEKAYYDFHVVVEDEERIRVLIAAVNSDVVRPYLNELKEKKTNVAQLSVSTSALGRLSGHVRGSGGVIFVGIGADGYEGGALKGGVWERSFTGTFPVSEEQALVRQVAEDVNALIETQGEKGGKPEVIVAHSPSETWCALLRDAVRAPVRYIREMDLKLLLPEHATKEVPYIALGGVLEFLRPVASGMNLLRKGVHTAARTPVSVTVVLVLLLAALGIYWVVAPLEIEQRRAEAIDREIAARKDEVKKVERLQKEVERIDKEIAEIDAFKTSRPMTLNLFKELTRILPKNVWLSRLRIAESTVEIEGYASSATEILAKLEASDAFRKAEFASSTFRDARMNADRFSIKMEVEGMPERKVENAKKK